MAVYDSKRDQLHDVSCGDPIFTCDAGCQTEAMFKKSTSSNMLQSLKDSLNIGGSELSSQTDITLPHLDSILERLEFLELLEKDRAQAVQNASL